MFSKGLFIKLIKIYQHFLYMLNDFASLVELLTLEIILQ